MAAGAEASTTENQQIRRLSMSSDLQRLMRAVKIIARLADKYEQEEVAEALLKHCSHRERDAVSYVGTYLGDVWHFLRKAHYEALPRCRECGADAGGRADARYCSPGCRQRAYRKRVTANHSNNGRKRHAAKVRDASHVRNRGEAVT
jgi:hypothetical protein